MINEVVLRLRNFLCVVDERKPSNLELVAYKKYGEYLVSIRKITQEQLDEVIKGE